MINLKHKDDIMKGMTDKEYKTCINNMGLLGEETIKLQYVCRKSSWRMSSVTGKQEEYLNKGLLVFTNENLIFMQQDGAFSSNYSQALRIPIEQIVGIFTGGAILKHVVIKTTHEEHKFGYFNIGKNPPIHQIRADIEELLKTVRAERKRSAQESLTKGTVPAMIFCKYCGARNKADQSRCANCGAVLT